MANTVSEQLEILRRISERGLNTAQINKESSYVDIFQHLLDEIQRTKFYYSNDYWEAF